jgi:hypothetical protein
MNGTIHPAPAIVTPLDLIGELFLLVKGYRASKRRNKRLMIWFT